MIEQLKDALGPEGWIALMAVLTGALTRALKPLPQIPKNALPWVALGIGFLILFGEAVLAGAGVRDSVRAGLAGVFAGSFAMAGHKTLKPLVARVSPVVAELLFAQSKPDAPAPGADEEPDIEVESSPAPKSGRSSGGDTSDPGG